MFIGGRSRSTSVSAPRAPRRFIQRVLSAGIAAACVAGLAASGTARAADTGKIGLDLPMLTSPFWEAYNNYLPVYAKKMGLAILAPVNSNGDPAQQITDMNTLLNLGAKGIVVGPLDSAAISRALDDAAAKHVPVVAVDVAPTQGKVAMVVRADNRAYGEKACKYIGEHVKAGKVVQIMGDLASVNGRDRSEAFRECLKGYPKLSLLEIPAAWKGDVAATALDYCRATSRSSIRYISLALRPSSFVISARVSPAFCSASSSRMSSPLSSAGAR